jgi:hypothetical protein
MITLPLASIYITKIHSDSNFYPFPIYESEYYKALQASSEAIYEDYLINLGRWHYKRPVTDKDEMSYSDFESLVLSLKMEGFKNVGKPITIYRGEAGDGQHRLAAMYFLYPSSQVKIDDKGKVIEWVL